MLTRRWKEISNIQDTLKNPSLSTKDRMRLISEWSKESIDIIKSQTVSLQKSILSKFSYCKYCDDYYYKDVFHHDYDVKIHQFELYHNGEYIYPEGCWEYIWYKICPKGHKSLNEDVIKNDWEKV